MGENNIQGLKNPRDPKKNLQDRCLEFFFFLLQCKVQTTFSSLMLANSRAEWEGFSREI